MPKDRVARFHIAARSMRAALILSSGAALVSTGCAGDQPLGQQFGSGVTGYVASNAFSPPGYSLAALPDGRFRVTATGNASTPASRVEKIALARAADYGQEQHKKFFSATAPQSTVRCGKRDAAIKGEKVKLPATGYTVSEIDVTYSDAANDPSFKAVRETAEALKAELLAEQVPADLQGQTFADIKARCGL